MPDLLFMVIDENSKFFYCDVPRTNKTYKLYSIKDGLIATWYTENWFVDRILNDNFVLQKIKLWKDMVIAPILQLAV